MKPSPLLVLERQLPDWAGVILLVPEGFLGPGTPGYFELRLKDQLPQFLPTLPPGFQFAAGSWWRPAPDFEPRAASEPIADPGVDAGVDVTLPDPDSSDAVDDDSLDGSDDGSNDDPNDETEVDGLDL